MSRTSAGRMGHANRFPRVSGDEPEQEATDGAQAPFSPREQG